MLVEPKTSPVKINHQIICGILTAVVYAALVNFKVGSAELLAIAIMNLVNFKLDRTSQV